MRTHSFTLAAVAALGLLGCQGKSDSPSNGSESRIPLQPAVLDVQHLAPAPRPIFLFNGADLTQWVNKTGAAAQWKLANGYVEVTPGTADLRTRQSIGDCRLHLEFYLPESTSLATAFPHGLSAILFQGRYELRIADSAGRTPTAEECGAIAGFKAPDQNACLKPGVWQSFDVNFRAPRFDASGRKVQDARLSAAQNGIVIHNNIALPAPAGVPESPAAAPLALADRGSPVRFRNIWITPIVP